MKTDRKTQLLVKLDSLNKKAESIAEKIKQIEAMIKEEDEKAEPAKQE